MNKEEHKPAPPYHTNVVSGAALEKLAEEGFRSMGIIHQFNMKWPCGHQGDAVEIINGRHPEKGSLKACYTCAKQYGLE